MRKILKIAKLELSLLIYSPVVWFVFPIFLVLCGQTFLGNLEQSRMIASLGYNSNPRLTDDLFNGQMGLFRVMPATLYLYIPILTMGLMSREISSGSIKLLLSSPVKLSQVILGKYLASVFLGFGFMLILITYGIVGVFSVQHADLGLICSGLLGLFLLICTYSAIGLFMSCLTGYQIVAAIATLATFAALNYIGSIGQSIDFVRDLTYFLSMAGRTRVMVSGLIISKDVIYFLTIIASFLMFSILYLKNQRDLKPWPIKAGRYFMVIGFALFFGYLSSRQNYTIYWDTTSTKSNSLSEVGQEIAKKIEGEVKVTTYVNMMAPHAWNLFPQSRNRDLAIMERYKRFIPGIDYKYVYYYADLADSTYAWYRNRSNSKSFQSIAENFAENGDLSIKDFIGPEEIKKVINLEPEGYLNVRKLEYNGKSTYLRFFPGEPNPYAGDAEWMAAFKRLLDGQVKVSFLTGNNERDVETKNDRGYREISASVTSRIALVNQGFDVDTLNINESDVRVDVNLLVLADPTIALSSVAQQRLMNYINRGGNLLITTEPGRQAIINPFLSQLGIRVLPGMLINPNRDLSIDQISATFSPEASGLDSIFDKALQNKVPSILKTAAAINYSTSNTFRIRKILNSTLGGWNRISPLDINTTTAKFSTEHGDLKGEFPITIAMSRNIANREQRIIISAEADFLSNSTYTNGRTDADKLIMLNGVMRWLSYGKFPIAIVNPVAKDITLNISKAQVTSLMMVFKYIMPSLIVLIGIIVLLRRRRN